MERTLGGPSAGLCSATAAREAWAAPTAASGSGNGAYLAWPLIGVLTGHPLLPVFPKY